MRRSSVFYVSVVVLTALLLAASAPSSASAAGARKAVKDSYSNAYLVKFSGEINPVSEYYLYRKLDVAERAGADLLVIEIDSPGGWAETSVDIAQRLGNIQWARTVAYVPRQALSGASIMSLGCDDIIIAPGATYGVAGMIFQDEQGMFHYAPEKFQSTMVNEVRTLAELKGRPTALAEALVNKDTVVYRVRNRDTGKETYLSRDEIRTSEKPDQWEELNEIYETREGFFLGLSGTRAVELGMAQGTAENVQDLKERYGVVGDVTVLEPTWVDTTVLILNLWPVTALLFIVGLIALYVEFSAPGISIGGLVALLCFGLFFWSRFLGGTGQWLDVVLFAAGVIFLVVELFVLPGFGVAGLTGILLIVISLIMASQTFVLPKNAWQWGRLTQTMLVIVGSGGVVAIAAFVLSKYLGAIPLVGRLALAPPTSVEVSPDGNAASAAGDVNAQGIAVGDVGEAACLLRPAGTVRIGGKRVDVVTDGEFIEAGTKVTVVEVRGNRVVVSRRSERRQRGRPFAFTWPPHVRRGAKLPHRRSRGPKVHPVTKPRASPWESVAC